VEGEGGGDGARKRERHMGLKRMESVLGRLVFGFFFIGASGPWYYYYFYGSAGAWYSVFFSREPVRVQIDCWACHGQMKMNWTDGVENWKAVIY
jgi:hypothetical protein